MSDKDPSLGNIPPIIPSRDEVVARQTSRKRPPGTPAQPRRAGGAGLLARLFIAVSLVVAAVACAWAWQLQQELQQADVAIADYARRIGDLEDRLSDTDEGMNQSSTAMAVKIKELYSEVDKLWASAWRRNKAKIEGLEKASTSHAGQLSTMSKTDADYSSQLKSLATDVRNLKTVAGDLERLGKTARSSETQLEKLGDDLNRMNLEFAKLQRRVITNEEWVESINGFRKQVNRSLSELSARINTLQNSPAGTPASAQ